MEVRVCQAMGCISAGGNEVFSSLEKELRGINLKIRLKPTGCHGFCQAGPTVILEPDGIFYANVKPQNTPLIVQSIIDAKLVESLLYRDPGSGKAIPVYREIPFYKLQLRRVLRNCGEINPEDIEEYIGAGGYKALERAMGLKPEDIIAEVKMSGLRGLGGAGFHTGRKWEVARNASGDEKFVVCNGDEGDPGAFQDRALMESDPHSIIEGMIIAGYAVGARRGFIYVRAEYPLAVKRLVIAVKQARERGFLGKKILGTDFGFDIEVFEGAGAFVCGEETALIASIEGRRGMPRHRPPYPAEEGLWGKPTIINNVKTFANIPLIILKGAEWFAGVGTEKSKGTAVFSLSGKISNTGLVEVPMGITLRGIIFGIGGGMSDGRKFKAVQTGGPSGGCLPESFLDMPIDFDSLTSAGSMMGSGGMIVMDEDTCMVDIARYFLDFTRRESCGQCIPCRLGTRQMFDILDKITKGEGRPEYLDLLLRLGGDVKKGSMCGLGKTAPNPVLTTIRYFEDEYKAHILERRCPAGVCKLG